MSTAKQKGVNETPQGVRQGNVNQGPEFAPEMAPILDAQLMEAVENSLNGQSNGTQDSAPALPMFGCGYDCRATYQKPRGGDANAGMGGM